MRFISYLMILLTIAIFIYSCKKEESEKYCWQMIDQLGNEIGMVCDKTEAELIACVNDRTCGVYTTGALASCFYYKIEGEEYCWYVDNTYMIKATENKLALLKKCFNLSSTITKVDCDYCQDWYNRRKSTYKPDGRFSYSPITRNQYCGDTARTLYQGREIIIKDDVDSLVVIQFSNNGTNW